RLHRPALAGAAGGPGRRGQCVGGRRVGAGQGAQGRPHGGAGVRGVRVRGERRLPVAAPPGGAGPARADSAPPALLVLPRRPAAVAASETTPGSRRGRGSGQPLRLTSSEGCASASSSSRPASPGGNRAAS